MRAHTVNPPVDVEGWITGVPEEHSVLEFPIVERKDTRALLLAAATKAIDRGGESKLNVHRVAREAGVTVPSVYHFFGSRDGLVEEAQAQRFEHGLQVVGVTLEEALATATSREMFRDSIKTWLRGITDSNGEFRKIRTTVLASAVNNSDLAIRVTRIQEFHVARIARYLRRGIDKGWLDDDVEIEAIIYWTITQLNGRLVIELDPEKTYARRWDTLFLESVFRALRID